MTPTIERAYRSPSVRRLALAAILLNMHARQATFFKERS